MVSYEDHMVRNRFEFVLKDKRNLLILMKYMILRNLSVFMH